MNVTWVILLFPVSVFPAKYPISFSSLCRYASGIIWLFLWSICHILTTDLKLQSRLVDRLQRPRLRSSPRRWVCRRRRRWTWPRSPGAGCRRGCWPGRASGLEPWYKILQTVHYWLSLGNLSNLLAFGGKHFNLKVEFCTVRSCYQKLNCIIQERRLWPNRSNLGRICYIKCLS